MPASYLDVARTGYPESDRAVFDAAGESQVAFFPGYPAAVAAVGALMGDTALALWLVTVISGAVAAFLVHRWSADQVGSEASAWATTALLVFPWAFVLYGAGYPEALFLAATVGAFRLLERDRPLAALTRAAGIGVVLGLALRTAERSGALTRDGWRLRFDRTRLRTRDLGVGVAALGLAAWVAFGWVRYGNPLAFSTAQRGWSQGFGERSLLKSGLWDRLLNDADRGFVFLLVAQGVVIVAACTLIPAVWRRLGAGYAAYCVVALGLSLLGSANFFSNGRFVAVALPVVAVVWERLSSQPRRQAVGWLAASAAGLVVFASFWGRGYLMG